MRIRKELTADPNRASRTDCQRHQTVPLITGFFVSCANERRLCGVRSVKLCLRFPALHAAEDFWPIVSSHRKPFPGFTQGCPGKVVLQCRRVFARSVAIQDGCVWRSFDDPTPPIFASGRSIASPSFEFAICASLPKPYLQPKNFPRTPLRKRGKKSQVRRNLKAARQSVALSSAAP